MKKIVLIAAFLTAWLITISQNYNLTVQIEALKQAGCERIYCDIASGAKTDHPGFRQALDYMREGDLLVVWRLDRLGRSLIHPIDTMALLEERGIGFRSLLGKKTSSIDSLS